MGKIMIDYLHKNIGTRCFIFDFFIVLMIGHISDHINIRCSQINGKMTHRIDYI